MKKALLVLLVLTTIGVGLVLTTAKKSSPEESLKENMRKYSVMIDKDDSPERWYLTKSEDAAKYKQHIEQVVSMLSAIAAKYENTNSETQRIYKHLEKAEWSVTNAPAIRHSDGLEIRSTVVRKGSSPAIILMATDVADKIKASKVDTMFSYNPRSNTIFIPCLEIPSALFACFIYHECCHAIQHLLGNDMTEEAKIEIQAYEVGNAIMLRAYPEYKTRIDQILDRKKLGDFKHAVASITVEDMEYFDKIILGPKINYGLVGYTQTIYQLGVGFAYIDRKRGSVEEKQALYKWMMKN